MSGYNDALWIACQTGQTAVAHATTGVAKNGCMEEFASCIDYHYHCFIPSLHLPEDLGGCTDIDRDNKESVVFPMNWIKQLQKPNQLLHIDEINTAPMTMMPPLLSIMNERRVGDVVFHPSTIIICAMNPPEMAPNSAPLSASINNRLYHHTWEFPMEDWIHGMTKNGGKFERRTDYPVVGDYSAYVPKWTALIGNLIKRNRGMCVTTTIPEDEFAFPSPRSLYRLAHCLAAADKVKADGHIFEQLSTGIVGKNVSTQVMQWIASMDLYDANDVISGKVKVDYSGDRVDQLCYLPVGILDALKDDHAKKRLDSATQVLIEMGENGLLDSVMPVLGSLSKTYPKYNVPKQLATRYGNIIAQLHA